jgi:uncharacterized protein (TIGR03089 family)
MNIGGRAGSGAQSVPASPEAAFAAALARDSGAPLLTFYDLSSGERIELSARSLANWVAKTHHLLIDELGLGPGDRAYVSLPPHWMAAPALLGIWSAGLAVSDVPDEVHVGFVAPRQAAAAADGELDVPDLYALSLTALGRPFEPGPPPGSEDYVLAVRPMPDAWAGVRSQAAPPDPAWEDADGVSMSRTQLMHRAAARAAELGLSPGGRLLAGGSPPWLDWLLAPLSVGASIVLAINPPDGDDGAALERVAQSERATARIPAS